VHAPAQDPARAAAAVPRVGVAIATRERRADLERTLARLLALPERPAVLVADNGSRDGSPAAVRARFPQVEVLELGANRGAAARTAAVARLATPYVAFSDDDSWWAPGALARAAALFDAHPRLGLIAARILVGEAGRLDPVCALMERSPLPAGDGAPGRSVLGFVACGAIVRREAFLAAGAFDVRFGIGGEERPLALRLAARGWQLRYVPEVVAHHHPAGGSRDGRRTAVLRNDMWTAWLHRPPRAALRRTRALLRDAPTRRQAAAAVAQAMRGAPWVAREREVVPPHVERGLRALERGEARG
jgi:GT2 family glycosyltransferase